MTPELGVLFLILALLSAGFHASFLLPLPRWRQFLAPLAASASWVQALCITMALCILILLRIDSDFSVVNVIQHSNRALPMLYKIAGAWGNHEGSMLLWAWVIALFGALLAGARHEDKPLLHTACAIQALLGTGILLFIIITSNPFVRQFPPTSDGQMLNPLLQDLALAMHPPLLYIGYVGFSVTFSLAVAGLAHGRAGREWAMFCHPWIMASWSALTLGIGLGSWWAYRELGWGGWWFWDPVENASLLPWLAGTALLHSNIVLKKRGTLTHWVLLLSIITFGLSLLGTFLVRSGVLTSVHSFASDPARGAFILCYIACVVGGALLLYAMRAGHIAANGTLTPASREGMMAVNNLFLLTACATVLLGTLYPMLSEMMGHGKLTVGPPYFNATFVPLMAFPLLLAGLAPFLPWKKALFVKAVRRTLPSLEAACVAMILGLATVSPHRFFTLCGMAVSVWLLCASLQWLFMSRHRMHTGTWALFLGHAGMGLLALGITISESYKQDKEAMAAPGEHLQIADYDIYFKRLSDISTDNYRATRAEMQLSRAGNATITVYPEYRTYHIRGSTTSEAALHNRFTHDVTLVIGETSPEDQRTAIRIYYSPMISLIWAGFVLMALGGCCSIHRHIRKSRATYSLRRPATLA